jgi:3-hydroxyisobutyrate dehydrogenase-like beta-hydroxyacid dehydrogenase
LREILEHPLTVCGFLGFGEVASRFAQRLRERGARVLAYDVLLEQPGGRDTLVARGAGTPPELLPLADLTAQADIVLSTVTTDVALSAAKDCVRLLRAGQVYVDLNATSPSVKCETASVIAPSGADFVEGAILSAVGVAGADARVLLCGARAGDVAAVLSKLGLNVHAYGIEIGKASSFKMLRSVFSKGIEALLIECLLAGRRAGIEQPLWEEIVATMDAASFGDIGGNWVRTHATAHGRRYHEMLQVADVLRELRIDAPMTAATVALFERSTRLALKDAFAAPPASPADVAAALDARIQASTNRNQGQ